VLKKRRAWVVVRAARGNASSAKAEVGHGEFILACDQSQAPLWRKVLGSLGEKIHHVGPIG